MITQHYSFSLKPESTNLFLRLFENDYIPILESYESVNYTEVWRLIDQPNTFIFETKWYESSLQDDIFNIKKFQDLIKMGMSSLESPIVTEKYESIVLYDEPIEIENIKFIAEQKNLRKRAIKVLVDPSHKDIFFRICEEHSPQFSKYGDRVKTLLTKNIEKDKEYVLNNFWQNPDDELDYFSGDGFKLFWKVINSVIEKSPITIYSKRIYSTKTNFNL